MCASWRRGVGWGAAASPLRSHPRRRNGGRVLAALMPPAQRPRLWSTRTGDSDALLVDGFPAGAEDPLTAYLRLLQYTWDISGGYGVRGNVCVCQCQCVSVCVSVRQCAAVCGSVRQCVCL